MEPVAWEFAWTGTSDPRSSLTAFVSRNRFWIQPPRLTEVSWRRGISAAALTRTVISGLRGHGRRGQQKHAAAEERERESVICSGQSLHEEPEYFHILLSDLRMYFSQTGGDCGQTSPLSLSEPVQWLSCAVLWCFIWICWETRQ